ncbi:MAG: OmpH family outer membrane protein [Saprospiraceae bacterium]|nr:OmpH family outer membrane protein [Bacteroidia bacterium]NNE15163.1 OmpH family outer membrane protein [Saprospiraceae bacterium]NNL91949.1 OmpH family outer membrane protein [Saprospiraceae bacterium]
MKNILFPLLLTLMISSFSFAQRIAVVDVSGILEDLADYKEAQAEIDKISAKWRQDIAQEYDKIKSMYNKYQAEQVLLSEDVRIEREEEIMEKEKQVRELQKRRFGPEGDLFRRRQELVSPIQDEVFTAIEDYATIKGYDLIFDKAGAAGLLYASDEFDKTSEIRRELGLKSN